jgi:V/A-type H+/Na+-transporting ATPase subunit C
MEQEYIYGVARIRALEGSLFTDETINQLVQCKDYDEAMDFLRTKGWGNGNPDQSLEEMLEQERRRTWKVLDELIEDKEQCEILTIANEYHNLKAAIKQVCTELETENVFYEDTKTDTEFLKNCIKQGNYNLLPKGIINSPLQCYPNHSCSPSFLLHVINHNNNSHIIFSHCNG